MPLDCPDCGGDCYGMGRGHQPCGLGSDANTSAGERVKCRSCGNEHKSISLIK